MKPRRNSRATVIFAGSIAALLSSHSAQAGDADNYTGPDAGSLLTTSSWSLEAVPTIANDAVFISESGIRKLTAKNLTVNSFNVTASSGTYSIRNETTTSTNSILTLGGAGSSSNLTAGAAAGDLIYVASGNTFNLRGDNSKGTGVLQVNLGQSGNFNIAGSSEISAAIGESGSSFGITKTGTGELTLTGTNTYTGATTISAGTLIVGDGISGSLGSTAVTVQSGATLGGSGSIAGPTTIQSGGIHAVGNSPGVQTFTNLTYDSGSIFSWEIDRTASQTRGTGYDAVNVSGALGGSNAIFRIVIGDSDFSDTFWDTTQTWSDIFTSDGSIAIADWATTFGGGFEYYNDAGTISGPTGGSFSLSGSTLSYSAVPEPTSALVGLLIAAGLLRRRWDSNEVSQNQAALAERGNLSGWDATPLSPLTTASSNAPPQKANF